MLHRQRGKTGSEFQKTFQCLMQAGTQCERENNLHLS